MLHTKTYGEHVMITYTAEWKNYLNILPKNILQKEFKYLAQAQTVSQGDKFWSWVAVLRALTPNQWLLYTARQLPKPSCAVEAVAGSPHQARNCESRPATFFPELVAPSHSLRRCSGIRERARERKPSTDTRPKAKGLQWWRAVCTLHDAVLRKS